MDQQMSMQRNYRDSFSVPVNEITDQMDLQVVELIDKQYSSISPEICYARKYDDRTFFFNSYHEPITREKGEWCELPPSDGQIVLTREVWTT